jgi:hypothetical protein
VLRWADEHGHDVFVDWTPFEHPELGPIEIGGWDDFRTWTNPPPGLIAAEVAGHADFAVHQALTAPCVEIVHDRVHPLGDGLWRIEVGVANTGFLPTTVSDHARKESLVLPLVATIDGPGVSVIGGSARRELGQLGGRLDARFSPQRNDGSPDRVLAVWTVRAPAGSTVEVVAAHQRAGTARRSLRL